MRTSLLSTYFENVGDDLIRAGVQRQLHTALGHSPTWLHTSKSNGLSLFSPLSRFSHAPSGRMNAIARRIAAGLETRLSESSTFKFFDKAVNTDLFVIAGTPLFYFVGGDNFLNVEAHSGGNWPETIFTKRLEPSGAPPLIALGVGSIYEGSPAGLLKSHPKAANFLSRFLRKARLVSTRDDRTYDLLRLACPERENILVRSVCPSLWAEPEARVKSTGRKVLIGYSTESSNWDLTKPREEVLRKRRLALDWVLQYFHGRGFEIVIAAHNQLDSNIQSALRLGNRAQLLTLNSAKDLTKAATEASLTVTWRVHGAMAALAAGRPAVLFRTDSRWPMAANLGASMVDDRCLHKEDLEAVLNQACNRAAFTRPWGVERLEIMKGLELNKLYSLLTSALSPAVSASHGPNAMPLVSNT